MLRNNWPVKVPLCRVLKNQKQYDRFLFLLFVLRWGFMCSSGWLWKPHPPASTSYVLELLVYVIAPSWTDSFEKLFPVDPTWGSGNTETSVISLILNISPMGNLHSEMQTSNLLLLNTMYLSMKTSSSNIQSYVQTLACQEQRINSQATA